MLSTSWRQGFQQEHQSRKIKLASLRALMQRSWHQENFTRHPIVNSLPVTLRRFSTLERTTGNIQTISPCPRGSTSLRVLLGAHRRDGASRLQPRVDTSLQALRREYLQHIRFDSSRHQIKKAGENFAPSTILLQLSSLRKELFQAGQVNVFVDACQSLLKQIESTVTDPRKHPLLKYMLVREILLHLVRLDQWVEAHALLMKYLDDLIHFPLFSWKRILRRRQHVKNEAKRVRLCKASKLYQLERTSSHEEQRDDAAVPLEVLDAIKMLEMIKISNSSPTSPTSDSTH